MDLWEACSQGDVAAARRLLKKGAAVDQAEASGATPLWIACEKGHVDAARLLLDKDAEVDRAASGWRTKGQTPLYIAKKNGHSAVVALLKKHSRSSGVCMVC